MDTPLNEEIEAIKRIFAERDALNVGIEARTKAMRERVRAGESTDDPVRDYVILKHGWVIEEFEKVYRGLIDKTMAHPGEFILLILRKENERFMFRSDPHENLRYSLGEYFFMGVLSDKPEFIMKYGGCEFTTTRYIPWNERRDDYSVETLNLSTGFSDPVFTLDQPLQTEHLFFPNGSVPKALEIHIGDEAVKLWFLGGIPTDDKRTEEALLRQYWALAEKLGRPQIPQHEREIIENPSLQSNPN